MVFRISEKKVGGKVKCLRRHLPFLCSCSKEIILIKRWQTHMFLTDTFLPKQLQQITLLAIIAAVSVMCMFIKLTLGSVVDACLQLSLHYVITWLGVVAGVCYLHEQGELIEVVLKALHADPPDRNFPRRFHSQQNIPCQDTDFRKPSASDVPWRCEGYFINRMQSSLSCLFFHFSKICIKI